jgi:hypothetical protein
VQFGSAPTAATVGAGFTLTVTAEDATGIALTGSSPTQPALNGTVLSGKTLD